MSGRVPLRCHWISCGELKYDWKSFTNSSLDYMTDLYDNIMSLTVNVCKDEIFGSEICENPCLLLFITRLPPWSR